MIRTLIVEHPPAIRRTLRARLMIEPDVAVVGEADDTASAVGLAQELQPDVVLLDAEMPHLDLGEAVRTLRGRSPSSAVVVLGLDPTRVARALDDGTATVVGKHEGTAALLAAIRDAAAGRRDP